MGGGIKMNKKAISPLIATVLIIGFTIVLAALVMQWGSALFRSTTESTGVTSDVNLKCSSGLSNFKVTEAKVDAITTTNVNIKVDNANDQQVSGVIIRKYVTSTGATTTETKVLPTDTIDSFGIKTYTVTGLIVGDEVGIIPEVKATDGKSYPCPGMESKVTVI